MHTAKIFLEKDIVWCLCKSFTRRGEVVFNHHQILHFLLLYVHLLDLMIRSWLRLCLFLIRTFNCMRWRRIQFFQFAHVLALALNWVESFALVGYLFIIIRYDFFGFSNNDIHLSLILRACDVWHEVLNQFVCVFSGHQVVLIVIVLLCLQSLVLVLCWLLPSLWLCSLISFCVACFVRFLFGSIIWAVCNSDWLKLIWVTTH